MFKIKDSIHRLSKLFGLPSTMHDMEQGEGIHNRNNKGKQSMLIAKDEEFSKWTHLPCDILKMIMTHLKLTDYLRIRAVCSSWRATATEAIANKHCHPLPELPLVFLKSQKKSILPSRFFSISTEQVCSLKYKNHMCHGIVEGWMILSENHIKEIFFLNPVTNDVVTLPPHLNFPSKSSIPNRTDLYMGKMVASSSPKCEDCVVVGLVSDLTRIAYCRVNSDKSWTMIEAENEIERFIDLEIFDGKVYVRTYRLTNSILVYDLRDYSDDPPKPKVLGLIPPIRQLPGSSNGIATSYLTRGYASEELLFINLFYDYVYEASNFGYIPLPHITKYEVFQLDTRKNKWVKLDHLGDRVIFLGNYKSFVMSRAALNSTEDLITENTIYFARYCECSERPWWGTQLGRFCLIDNSTKYFSLEQFGHELYAYPFWFIPSFW